MKPTVGRIVHLNMPNGPLAAIVTQVFSDTIVNLCVFNANGVASHRESVEFGDEHMQWNWPPRVG